jgi:hypothetical protein
MAVRKAKAPVKTSERKRPNKKFIEATVALRGYMTGNEKTQLASLEVKNAMQRMNNRTMSDDVNDNFSGAKNEALQKLMKRFVKDINAVINGK